MIYRVSYVLVNGVVVTKSFDANSKEDAKEQAWAEEEDHEISYIKEVIQSAPQAASQQADDFDASTLEAADQALKRIEAHAPVYDKAWLDRVSNIGAPQAATTASESDDDKWFFITPDERAAFAPVQAAQPALPAEPIELVGVREEMEKGSGFWSSCSGCYDTEDGHPTGPYSYSHVFGCALGSGCSECGGIGAVWDNTDYEAMAADWDKPDDAAPGAAQTTDAREGGAK